MTVKKPFLREGNKEKMLKHASLHKNWTENLWQWVLLSDDYISLYEGGQERGREGLHLSTTSGGIKGLLKIDGIMNAENYSQKIHLAIPSGKYLIDNGFIFQNSSA